MRLEQLTSRIFYYPHQPETDRPMLAYINGSRISPVSYTHLDVYKRQECGHMKMCPLFSAADLMAGS